MIKTKIPNPSSRSFLLRTPQVTDVFFAALPFPLISSHLFDRGGAADTFTFSSLTLALFSQPRGLPVC